jgi:hypothetical protein
MTSSFTSNKTLELPANGDYVDYWNVPLNGDMTIIDTALGGVTSLNAGSGSATLTVAQYRPLIISISGTLAANITYTIPSGVGGQWIVRNAATGGSYTVTIASGGGGTSVVAERDVSTVVYSDGTNIRYSDNWTRAKLAAGSNTQIQYNTSGLLDASANLVYSGGRLGVGTASPTQALEVAGTIYSTSGGFKFPDGSVQATASAGAPTSYVATIDFGATGLLPSTPSVGAVTVAGTLAVANGGTGITSSGAAGNILTSNGTGWASSAPVIFPSGTAMLFAQTAAPTGWTKSTTHDNKALRVVSGTASSGGSVAFTSAFASQSVIGTVGDTALTIAQMPAHTHQVGAWYSVYTSSPASYSVQNYPGTTTSFTTSSVGSGDVHTHTFTGTAINLAVQYVDVIIATKD